MCKIFSKKISLSLLKCDFIFPDYLHFGHIIVAVFLHFIAFLLQFSLYDVHFCRIIATTSSIIYIVYNTNVLTCKI